MKKIAVLGVVILLAGLMTGCCTGVDNKSIPENIQKEYKNLKDFQEDVYLNFTDGTQASLRSLTSDRGGTFGNSWVSCEATFNPILDLDTVESVQVGPYICELE